MSIERRYPLLKHDHDAADITSGIFSPGLLGSGTADSTKFLRGDSIWSDTLTGNLFVTGRFQASGGEALRMVSDSAFLSFYNTAGTVRNAFIQATGTQLYYYTEAASPITHHRFFVQDSERFSVGSSDINIYNAYLRIRPANGTAVLRFQARTDTTQDATWIQWYRADGSTERAYVGFGANGSDEFVVRAQLGGLTTQSASWIRSILGSTEYQRLDTDSTHVGHLRATAWYGGAHTLSGLGAELGISGGVAYLLAFNRSAGTYGPVAVQGTDLRMEGVSGFTGSFRGANFGTGSVKEWRFAGTAQSTLIYYGANEDVYIRPGTTSGIVYIGQSGAYGADTLEIRGAGVSPNVRIVSQNGSPWALELYRADYAEGSKVFMHRYDGVNNGWAFEHMPYILGARSPNGGRMLLPGSGGSGSNQETHFISNINGSSAIRTISADNASGAWLYSSGSDFGLLDHGGNWAWHYDLTNGAWRAQRGNKEVWANGFRYEDDSNFYLYNTSGYSYGSWRIGGTRGGYVGLVLDGTKRWTWMSDGTVMGLYNQVDGRWSYYDPNDGWMYHYSNGQDLQFGGASATWWHFYTTSTNFYFNEPIHANGGVVRYSQGSYTHYASSSLLSGSITVQSGGSPSGGSDGDQFLIY